jgi:hypothetical protein
MENLESYLMQHVEYTHKKHTNVPHAIADVRKKENKFMRIMDTEQKEWHG